MKNNDFLEYFTKSLDKCFVSYENIIIFGDLNFKWYMWYFQFITTG
jgi:hypothetical protein